MTLNLTPDELLSTTRAVRKRLDLERPVELSLIYECLQLAVQAPSGSNAQGWHFVVVTKPDVKEKVADLYRKAWSIYSRPFRSMIPRNRVASSAAYLAEHMHQVPVLLVPCVAGRTDDAGTNTLSQASQYGSILPAVWSFMLAARARGLGTCWTTLHLMYEQEAATALGIPFESITQVALIPVAYTQGETFKPAQRKPLEGIVHVNGW